MTLANYNPDFFEALASAEDKHFWFVHRNRVIQGVLDQPGFAPPRRVLEVGCGTGNVLRVLAAAWPGALVVGLEVFGEGLAVARMRTSAALVRGRIEALPFLHSFDVVGMFDVLEHIEDDLGALQAVRRQLSPGGRLLLTVPAHRWLWSDFDIASGHARRYSTGTLQNVLRESGFRLTYLTQFMAPLVPLVWISRRLRTHDAADAVNRELHVSPGMNGILSAVLGLERRWLARQGRLPAGTSLLAVAVPA